MKHAGVLRMRAREQNLNAVDAFWLFDNIDALNKLWNGYGPDKWPACIRKIMTWIYRNYEETALIHDFDYTFSDKSIEGWIASDKRFADNFKKQIDIRYPLWKAWLWPFRSIALSKRKAAMVALELGGYTAWCD